MKISCLVPTRGNVVGMTEFADSIFTTATDPSCVEIVFYIDNDDLPSKECADKLKERYNIKYLFENRIPLGKTVDECHKLSSGDIFFCGSDDIIMLTKGWDDIIIDAFDKIEDKIALFYGLELLHDVSRGGHYFVHRRWLEVLGYITPQYFGTGDNDQTWCNNQFSVVSDKWVNTISKKIMRRFFVEIYHQHVNPRHNKGQKFVRRKHGGPVREDLDLLMKDEDNNPRTLYRSLKEERRNDAMKLTAAIYDFQSNKQTKFASVITDEYTEEVQRTYFK